MVRIVYHTRIRKLSGKGYWISKICVLDERGNTVFDCYALEDAAECPPVGTWELVLEYSPKFGRKLYEMKGIPGRAEIKYHVGNTLADTDGCPLLGANYIGNTVNGSRLALDRFMRAMRGVDCTTVTISIQ